MRFSPLVRITRSGIGHAAGEEERLQNMLIYGVRACNWPVTFDGLGKAARRRGDFLPPAIAQGNRKREYFIVLRQLANSA